MYTYSLIIIGGGPSGLFCALQTSKSGNSVLVLEKNSSCGKKLLISGSGQCNLTHDGEILSFISHYGDNGMFLKPSLKNFTNKDLVTFFAERGVQFSSEPGGKIFPQSRKSKDIVEILLHECAERGVVIKCDEPVISLEKNGDYFQVSSTKNTYLAETVVIATGGITYPATGSTGDGYRFAEKLGHRIVPAKPGLVSILVQDYPFLDLSGISFPHSDISLFREGKKIKKHTGDILFTHSGLSGPGILDFSRFIQPGDTISLSFIPGGEPQKIKEILVSRFSASGNRQVRTVLTEFSLPDRFIKKIFEVAGIDQTITGAHLNKQDRNRLIDYLTGFQCLVMRLGSIHEAMVTCGGISLEEIQQKTMESKLVPGLFFTGEVMDIDGDTGGYNLQAAFSTGALAAKQIVKKSAISGQQNSGSNPNSGYFDK